MPQPTTFRRVMSCLMLIAPLLLVTARAAAQPPTATLTVDPDGEFDRKALMATIHGTVTCSADTVNDQLSVALTQTVGRQARIIGSRDVENVPCQAGEVPWSVTVSASEGTFGAGFALADLRIIVCNALDECAVASTTARVHLSGGGH